MEMRIHPHRAASSAVRRSLERELYCLGARLDGVKVVASELVTNAVLHGAEPIVVRAVVKDGDRVRLEVSDGRPDMNEATRESRGLQLVGHFASEWGITPHGTGKIVWAEL